MGEDYFLSLHAISGRPQHKAIQLRALARNQALAILVDSRSSHIFLSSVVASKLQVVATTISPMAVKVANGASLPVLLKSEILSGGFRATLSKSMLI
jgi:hypothetical protein